MTKVKKQKVNNFKEISPFAHASAREFVVAYSKQDENTYDIYSHYFRGGSARLANVENKVAELVGAKKGNLVLTTAGMSAVINILEVANLTANSVVIHGATEYSQIYNYINSDLRERGVIPVEIDYSETALIESGLKQAVKKYGKGAVKVIFFEAVGNGPSMPVLEIEKFLELSVLKEIDPLIVIDNTLPTNSVVPLAKLIKESTLKIVGVESATKFYLKNQDLGGFYFTNNKSLLQKLLTKRKRIGVTPGPSLIIRFEKLLAKTRQQFENRNRKIVKNTKFLAEACTKARGFGDLFTVSYPNLKSHKNYDYSHKLYPEGIAPVFFISTVIDSGWSAEELFYHLDDTGAFEDVIITESFGFDITCVSASTRYGGYIRIAGGLEGHAKIREIADRLQKALSGLKNKVR